MMDNNWWTTVRINFVTLEKNGTMKKIRNSEVYWSKELQMGIDDRLSKPMKLERAGKMLRFARKAEWTGSHWQKYSRRPWREI